MYNRILFTLVLLLAVTGTLLPGPVITEVRYSEIETYTVKITWKTNEFSDSKIRWMQSDSNYQAINYTDSLYSAAFDTLHSLTLTFLNPYTLYNFNITSASGNGSTTTQNMMFATRSVNDGTIKIFFNKSVDTTVSTGINAEGNADLKVKLLARIESSGYYIDGVISSFEDIVAADLTSALIRAHNNGIVIRIIYGGVQDSQWLDTLKAYGIKVIKRNYDNAPGHCLNTNYWVFDARCTCAGGEVYVWTSTAPVTYEGFYTDKNSALQVNDRTLAYIYTREIDEMWGSYSDYPDTTLSKFGSLKKDNVPHLVNLNGVYAEVYFGPSDSLHRQVRNFLQGSQAAVIFGTYDFNSQGVYDALYGLRNSRNIRGIFDKSKLNISYFNGMKMWSDVYKDSTAGKFHHKYIISDPYGNNGGSRVLTGSADWTNESNLYNDEDMMIIHSPAAANQYYQEFHQRYKEVSGHVVSISTVSTEVPEEIKLFQNYPNPFNAETVIMFSLKSESDVRLSIYNVLGQETAVLANSRYKAGTYQVRFNSTSISSGIYYYRLSAGNFSAVKKLVITK